MQLRALWNSVSAKSYSAANTLACSSVALIPVRSLPLLQDVKRSPAINNKITILYLFVYATHYITLLYCIRVPNSCTCI